MIRTWLQFGDNPEVRRSSGHVRRTIFESGAFVQRHDAGG